MQTKLTPDQAEFYAKCYVEEKYPSTSYPTGFNIYYIRVGVDDSHDPPIYSSSLPLLTVNDDEEAKRHWRVGEYLVKVNVEGVNLLSTRILRRP